MQKGISDSLNQRRRGKLHQYILLGGQTGKIPIPGCSFPGLLLSFVSQSLLLLLNSSGRYKIVFIILGHFYHG